MKLIWLLLCFNLLLGCDLFDVGTGTGNPIDSNNGIPDEGTIGSYDPIPEEICLLLAECNDGLTFNDCYYQVGDLDNLNESLGLPANAYDSIFDIYDAEARGEINGNIGAHEQCIDQISILACTDTDVANAYNPSLTPAFINVKDMMPSVCEDIF